MTRAAKAAGRAAEAAGPTARHTHHMNDTAVGAGGLGAEDRRA